MWRSRLAKAAIILFPAISCFDIASGLEHWPFSNYPMYSLLYSSNLTTLRLYGITKAGEMEMRGDHQFAPFDQARLTMSLDRLSARNDRDRTLQAALRNLLQLYRDGHTSGPEVSGLRLYRVSWNLRAGMSSSELPDTRALIAETPE